VVLDVELGLDEVLESEEGPAVPVAVDDCTIDIQGRAGPYGQALGRCSHQVECTTLFHNVVAKRIGRTDRYILASANNDCRHRRSVQQKKNWQ
jgi:hypothetical protein